MSHSILVGCLPLPPPLGSPLLPLHVPLGTAVWFFVPPLPLPKAQPDVFTSGPLAAGILALCSATKLMI